MEMRTASSQAHVSEYLLLSWGMVWEGLGSAFLWEVCYWGWGLGVYKDCYIPCAVACLLLEM